MYNFRVKGVPQIKNIILVINLLKTKGITCFISESTTSASRQRQNSPKSGKFTPLYLNNHLIINSNNSNLDFYIYSIAAIKVI